MEVGWIFGEKSAIVLYVCLSALLGILSRPLTIPGASRKPDKQNRTRDF
jgi:hypothetical protein